MHPVLKRNCEVFSACDWPAALTAHIPNAGEHLVRYNGRYSNVNRGKRRKAQGENSSRIEKLNDVSTSAAKRAWARLTKHVYEMDPLVCPRCAGLLRLVAFIEQREVVEQTLHISASSPPPVSPPSSSSGSSAPADRRPSSEVSEASPTYRALPARTSAESSPPHPLQPLVSTRLRPRRATRRVGWNWSCILYWRRGVYRAAGRVAMHWFEKNSKKEKR
jgi:hypothetical protein